MSNCLALRLVVALSLCMAVAHAQAVVPLSEVKVIVFDQAGGVIPDSEVTFKSHSNTFVSHTGMDGLIKVMLPSDQYNVTTSRLGFLKNEVFDFRITAPGPNEIKVVMAVAPPTIVCTLPCGPYFNLLVPTTTSDLPNFIEYEPAPDPLAQTLAQKTRSWHCLYLWKCVSPQMSNSSD